MRKTIGFTLIELLIVVAIIAILAAIAIPNLLEAQIRAKVSRVKSEQKTLALALESYHVDNNSYPNWMWYGYSIIPNIKRLVRLSTPIAYISSIPARDPFQDRYQPDVYDTYDYVDAESFAKNGESKPSYRTRGADWRLCSAGPDLYNTYGGPKTFNPDNNLGYDYDPSNGTVSNGDICSVGSRSRYSGNELYPNKIE